MDTAVNILGIAGLLAYAVIIGLENPRRKIQEVQYSVEQLMEHC